MATAFQDYFMNVAPNLEKKIPKTDRSFLSYMPRVGDEVQQLDLSREVSAKTISLIIGNMKNKSSFSFDYCSNKMLKACRVPLSKPIAHLVSLSLKLGYMPKSWKLAKIVPVHKKDSTDTPSNYRPISLLPTVSKVIEKVVANRITHHLNKWKLYYPLQFGFRSSMSCENLLLKFIDQINKAKRSNHHFISIMVDFAKAFDTVPSNILLAKLEHLKISTTWLRSYLEGRYQAVQVGNSISALELITCGVPQGSILGPLLFLCFISDIAYCSGFGTFSFADDTTLTLSDKSLDNLFLRANIMLHDFAEWCFVNRLSLAPTKTRYILFSKVKEVPELILMRQPIKRIHECSPDERSFKLVGIHLDDSLSWKYHVDHVRKKILGVLHMMKKSKNYIPAAMKKMIFCSLIQSQLSYCISIYGGAAKSTIDPLVKIQKRALRLVNEAHSSKHTDHMFAAAGCLKFQDMHKWACARICVKYFNDNLPEGNMDCLEEKRTTYSTRSLDDGRVLNIPSALSKQMEQMCATTIPTIWNKEVPSGIKHFQEATFLSAYKDHFLQQYKAFTCTKSNCYSCKQ